MPNRFCSYNTHSHDIMHELLLFHIWFYFFYFFSTMSTKHTRIYISTIVYWIVPVQRAHFATHSNSQIHEFSAAPPLPHRRIENNTFTVHNIVSYNLIYGMDLPPIFFLLDAHSCMGSELYFVTVLLRAVRVVCFMLKEEKKLWSQANGWNVCAVCVYLWMFIVGVC